MSELGWLRARLDPPPRHTSRPLPAYRHLPGRTPHPVNHPEGHSFGARGVVLPESLRLPEGWRDCEEYLFGMDLFNHAYLWEAHEAWEACWHAAGHASLTGGFLQGLIQIAAALLKHHGGVAAGATRLAEKAARRLDDVERRLESPAEAYMGVRLPEWRLRVEAFLAGRCDEFPSLVLDFRVRGRASVVS